MADKFCPKCGTEINKGSVFCANCGHRLGRKSAKPKMSRKARFRLAVLLATAWVVGSSLLISNISIGREDYRCSGGFFDTLSSCANYSSATFNLSNPNNLVVLLLSVVALFLIYRLWLKGEVVKRWRAWVLVLFSFLTITWSVTTAYQGEQKNDHVLLPKCDINLNSYIATGSSGCGAETDNALKTKTFDELAGSTDNNDSAPILALYWLIYLGVASFIILRSAKHAGHEAAVE